MTNISWSSDCALYLDDFKMYEKVILIKRQNGLLFELKKRSQWPIFHGPVSLPYILKTVYCLMYEHDIFG